MFNGGGALRGNLDYNTHDLSVTMHVLGCGTFGVYASEKPRACVVNNDLDVPISYDAHSGLATVSLPQNKEGHLWSVTMSF